MSLLNLSVPLTPIDRQGASMVSSLITMPDDEGSNHNDNGNGNDNDYDTNNSNDSNNNNSNNDREDEITIKENQLLLLRILGKPYARNMAFWAKVLPLSILLGGLIGIFVAGFLITIQTLLDQWLNTPPTRHRGEVWWIIITTAGGLLHGLILVSPGVFKHGMIRTLLHNVHNLKGHVLETTLVVASNIILLATGAPLGPELAIAALGSGLAALLSKSFQLERRLEMGLVQAGLAASLGTFLLSPIVGVVLQHELSVTARPGDLLLDTLARSEGGISRDLSAHRDHDWMEQLAMGGTAATGAFVVMQLLAPYLAFGWFPVNSNLGGNDHDGDVFQLWHLVAAIPIGIVGGVVGTLAVGLIALFQSIRLVTCSFLHGRCQFSKWVGTLLFCSLGGAVHGALSFWNPHLVCSGMQLFARILREPSYADNFPGLLVTAFGKLLSTSACIGFGLVGGPIVPLMYVGLCLGVAATPLLPISVAVPCCMCATVGSLLPIPFTLTFFLAVSMSLSAHQIGPPFVAAVVAFTVVGGLGVVKKFWEERLGYAVPDLGQRQWALSRGEGGGADPMFQYELMGEEADDDEWGQHRREIHSAVYGT